LGQGKGQTAGITELIVQSSRSSQEGLFIQHNVAWRESLFRKDAELLDSGVSEKSEDLLRVSMLNDLLLRVFSQVGELNNFHFKLGCDFYHLIIEISNCLIGIPVRLMLVPDVQLSSHMAAIRITIEMHIVKVRHT
jgi:hypothetical protein